MKLSIVIPAYNEARRLPGTLAAVAGYVESAELDAEIIVVDDGSTDGTVERVLELQEQGLPLRVVAFRANRGKGAAVRYGLLAARGDHVLFMDADNATDLSEHGKLLAACVTGVEVAIGSRYLEPGSIKVRQSRRRVWVSRMGNRVIRYTLLPGVLDTQCGFKLFTNDAAKAIARCLTLAGYSFDIELLVTAKCLGYEVKEVPVDWYDAPGTQLKLARTAMRTLGEVLALRFGGAGRSPQGRGQPSTALEAFKLPSTTHTSVPS
jgi:dolichyl-phosphate beta-glucosyltransferase